MTTPSSSTAARLDLRFVQVVRDEFAFLVDDFGFHLAHSDPPTWVRYESPSVFVNVYHGRRSYEIDVEMGRTDDRTGRVFRIADTVGALMAPSAPPLLHFQASDRKTVRNCVHQLATLVREHCGPLLKGDHRAFARVEAYRSDIAAVVTDRYVHYPTRQAAELAWRAKDLAKVRQLYEAIGEGLSASEKRRLEYARKHCGSK